jgi:hypothetical protein
MDNNSENFSPEESLLVIQSMIDKTKNSVADKSFYFLLWGWLVLIASLGQFVLKVIVRTDLHPIVWNLMFAGVIVSWFHGRKERSKIRVRTYIDESIQHVWISIGFCQGLLIFIFARNNHWEYCYTFFMMLYAIGCFITGRILKFAPLVWGAFASWALVVVSTFTSYDYNILLMAAAILLSYIIPGQLLRRKYKKTIIKTA